MFRIGFADALAYRAEFLIWILSTNMSLVMLALWNAVAREHPIGRWGQKDFIAYFLSVLVVRLVTGSWVVWEMNYELRQGLLAFRMLRPVHPLVHYAAENLAALPVRGFFAAPIALVSLMVMGPEQVTHDPVRLTVFAVSVLGAWLINFLAMSIIGSISFFIDNSMAIFQVWFGLYMLLSGYLIPLDFFPTVLRQATSALPFRYMLSFPVEVLLGQLSRVRALEQLGVQAAFITLLLVCLSFVWRAGVRRFNAFGG
jgi:ABC-2 type transport system permease protein